MTREPVDLDGRRTAAQKLEIRWWRCPANVNSSPGQVEDFDQYGIDVEMLVGPSRNWPEVEEKVRFLLERYALTLDAQDPRIRKLIKRALGDLARLKKREEEKS